MSKLEQLIDELCPNGVEWKKLGNITQSIKTGLNPRQNFKLNDIGASNFYVTVKEITTGKVCFSEKTDKINEKALKIIQNRSKLERGDVLFSGIGTIGKVAIVDISTENWNCSESIFLIKPNQNLLNSRFLMHILRSDIVVNQYKSQSVGSTLKGIRMATLSTLLIPLPPLAVQEKIVRILDTFTELTAELTAELTMRKQQYEYYRDSLLIFGEEVPIFQLNEVAQYSKDRINAIEVDKTTYIGVDNLLQDRQGKTDSNYVPTEGRLTRYEKNNILIGNIRPYLKKIWFSDTYGGTNGDVLVIQPINDKLLPKYLYVLLCTEKFFNYNMQNAKGAKMPRGNKEVIMHYSFHLPSLEEQQRIIDILDRFDTLCNDISQGLPAEIKMRQQQYEYYRNKLLTFEKAKVE